MSLIVEPNGDEHYFTASRYEAELCSVCSHHYDYALHLGTACHRRWLQDHLPPREEGRVYSTHEQTPTSSPGSGRADPGRERNT